MRRRVFSVLRGLVGAKPLRGRMTFGPDLLIDDIRFAECLHRVPPGERLEPQPREKP